MKKLAKAGNADSARKEKLSKAIFETLESRRMLTAAPQITGGLIVLENGTVHKFGDASSAPVSSPLFDDGLGNLDQSDGGKIVVGSTDGEFAIARYESNGALDTEFGGDGFVQTDIDNGATKVSLIVTMSDGSVMVFGGDGEDFAAQRFTASGSVDSSFSDAPNTAHAAEFVGPIQSAQSKMAHIMSLSGSPSDRSVSITGQANATEDLTYTLDVSSDLPDQSVASWRIDWGDGNVTDPYVPSDNLPQHTYTTAGSFTIRAVARLDSFRVVADGSDVNMPTASVIKTPLLDIDPDAQLDIEDNAMIVTNHDLQNRAQIEAFIASGYNGGGWDGNGIVSSFAAGNGAFAWKIGSTLNVKFDGSATPITIGASGSDITAKLGNGSPVTFAGVTSLSARGSTASDALTIDGISVTLDTGGTDTLALSLMNNAHVTFKGTEHLSALTIPTGSTAAMTSGTDKVLVLGSLSLTGGQLDLVDNAMIVKTGGITPVRTKIMSGYNGGGVSAWTGAGIIASGTIGGGDALLGYAAGNDSYIASLGGHLKGESFASTSDYALVKFTLQGDSDLDGDVDDVDATHWSSNFTGSLAKPIGTLTPSRLWTKGDWDYDGDTDGSDIAPFINNYTGSNPDATPARTYASPGAGSTAGTGIGVMEAQDAFIGTFAGQSVADEDVLVKFTYLGDSNLDGVVDSNDPFTLAASGGRWFTGDYDYDGDVDSADQTLRTQGAAAYAASTGGTISQSGSAVVKDTLSATPQAVAVAPRAPESLSADDGSGTSVVLNWTIQSSGQTGFDIYRSDDEGDWNYIDSVAANATGYTDTYQLPDKIVTVQYRVVASSDSGESAPSNVASARGSAYQQLFTNALDSHWTWPTKNAQGIAQQIGNGTGTLALDMPKHDSVTIGFGGTTGTGTFEVNVDGNLIFRSVNGVVDTQASRPNVFSGGLYAITMPHTDPSITVTYTCSGLTGGATWILSQAGVTPNRTHVQIGWTEQSHYATEGGADAQFRLTRDSALIDQPLDITWQDALGTTVTSGDYIIYALGDSNHTALGNTLTIPANQTYADFVLHAVDDTNPEWTEVRGIELVTGTSYAGHPNAYVLLPEIVDNDLSVDGLPDVMQVNNDDDDENGIPDKDQRGPVDADFEDELDQSQHGDDDLYELHLHFPTDVKEGAVVSLTANPAQVHIWQNRDRSGKEFIKDGQSTYYWIVGPGHTIPEEVYVEAMSGSTEIDDVGISLAASDEFALATPTQPTSTTAPSTNYSAEIRIKAGGIDVSGKRRDWVIGQMADITAEIVAPNPPANPTFAWDVPGNALRDYYVTAGDTQGFTIDLANSDIDDDAVGLARKEVKFFWASTDGADPNARKVTVEVGNINGATFKAETTFDVFSPSLNAVSQLSLQPTSIADIQQDVAGLMNPGLTYVGRVDLDPRFAVGTFSFVQLITPQMKFTENNNKEFKIKNNDLQRGLDTKFPLLGQSWTTAHPADQLLIEGPNANVFATSDLPHMPAPHLDWKSVILNDQFKVYVMFKPSGADSQWVPLANAEWYVKVKGTTNGQGGNWTVVPADTGAGTNPFVVSAEFPEWSILHKSGEMEFIQVLPPLP